MASAANVSGRLPWVKMRASCRCAGRVLAILLAAQGAACGASPNGPPTPATTPAAIPRFELSVDQARHHFEQHSMECLGPAVPFVDSREWLCVQDNVASTNTVRIVGDAVGVSQLVGVSKGESADGAISFLLGVVAAAVVPQAEGEAMLFQAVSRPELPGAWPLESAAVELQAHSDARAVIVNPPRERGGR